MGKNIGQYLSGLMLHDHYTQSSLAKELGISRQMLSNIMLDQKEVSLPLSLKIESLFSLPEGVILKMQCEFKIQEYKEQLREELFEKLKLAHAFWSYDVNSMDGLPDEMLIEKVFIHLDKDDIEKLFELFPKPYVRKVWRQNMAIQGDYLFDLNVMIAIYYFRIPNPEAYLRRQESLYIKNMIQNV